MLDQKSVRTDPAAIADVLAKKGFVLDVERINALEVQRKDLQVSAESLQAERNRRAKTIGQAKASGEDIAPLLAEVSQLKSELESAETKLNDIQVQLEEIMWGIPNLPDAEVPVGISEEDNIEIHRWGEVRDFEFEIRDHVDLGAGFGLLDFEVATKITGSRFAVMHG